MIDHVSLGVADLARSAAFYEAVLGALGHARLISRPGTVGFGKRYPEFWINLRAGMPPVDPATGVHVCLRARSAEEVEAFHRAALAHGGADGGAPGPRPEYGLPETIYFAAFVRDPDGNRIEAVTFLARP
jgi:catechol 2,3-dioxygenase-like lactoylglutathione lyase family enzyme